MIQCFDSMFDSLIWCDSIHIDSMWFNVIQCFFEEWMEKEFHEEWMEKECNDGKWAKKGETNGHFLEEEC